MINTINVEEDMALALLRHKTLVHPKYKQYLNDKCKAFLKRAALQDMWANTENLDDVDKAILIVLFEFIEIDFDDSHPLKLAFTLEDLALRSGIDLDNISRKLDKLYPLALATHSEIIYDYAMVRTD